MNQTNLIKLPSGRIVNRSVIREYDFIEWEVIGKSQVRIECSPDGVRTVTEYLSSPYSELFMEWIGKPAEELNFCDTLVFYAYDPILGRERIYSRSEVSYALPTYWGNTNKVAYLELYLGHEKPKTYTEEYAAEILKWLRWDIFDLSAEAAKVA